LRNEPYWITPEIVIDLNQEVLEGTTEPHCLLSYELLDSACQRPYNYYEYEGIEDIIFLATILLFGIAANHPFEQGNKRAAFAAMIIFLEDNGYRLALQDDPRCADDLIAVLEDGISRDAFEESLRRVVAPLDERIW
jgi:death-on-curing protein